MISAKNIRTYCVFWPYKSCIMFTVHIHIVHYISERSKGWPLLGCRLQDTDEEMLFKTQEIFNSKISLIFDDLRVRFRVNIERSDT